MAYMSEEGYKQLIEELKYLESVERPKIGRLLPKRVIRETCQKMPNMMLPKRRKVYWR